MSERPTTEGSKFSRLRKPVGRLRDLPIWSKLGLIMIVPTIATIVVGTTGLVANISAADDADRTRTLARLSLQAGAVIQELQNERATGVLFVGSPEATRGTVQESYEKQIPLTDNAIAQYRQNRRAVGDLGGDPQRTLNAADSSLNDLNRLRDQVKKVNVLSQTNIASNYRAVISGLTQVRETAIRLTTDSKLNTSQQAAAAVSDRKTAINDERVVILRVLAGQTTNNEANGLTLALRREYDNAHAAEDAATNRFNATSTAAERELLDQTLTGSDLRKALVFEGQIESVNAASGAGPTFRAPDWDAAIATKTNLLRQVELTLDERIVVAATEVRDDLRQTVLIQTGLLLSMLLLAILFAWMVARSMARSLRELRHGALTVAQYGLPQAVARLREPSLAIGASPEHIAKQIAEPLPVRSRDEFGQVTEAFNAVHLEAVRTAAEQAQLRSSVATMFVNLARRSQILVDRLIGHLDRLERGEEDPDRLAELFQLDHLATRMRRNDENLLVLAGADSSRVQREPAPLMDVLRAAQSEVEHYTRIEFGMIDRDVEIAAHSVNDMVHLVAELLDNATAFSPPDSAVVVEARRVGERCVLLVEDRGIGISPDQLRELNEKLGNPPAVDVAVSRMMGLVVVARLAARHGVRVELRAARERGTVADITLPASVLVQRMVAGRNTGELPVVGGGSDRSLQGPPSRPAMGMPSTLSIEGGDRPSGPRERTPSAFASGPAFSPATPAGPSRASGPSSIGPSSLGRGPSAPDSPSRPLAPTSGGPMQPPAGRTPGIPGAQPPAFGGGQQPPASSAFQRPSALSGGQGGPGSFGGPGAPGGPGRPGTPSGPPASGRGGLPPWSDLTGASTAPNGNGSHGPAGGPGNGASGGPGGPGSPESNPQGLPTRRAGDNWVDQNEPSEPGSIPRQRPADTNSPQPTGAQSAGLPTRPTTPTGGPTTSGPTGPGGPTAPGALAGRPTGSAAPLGAPTSGLPTRPSSPASPAVPTSGAPTSGPGGLAPTGPSGLAGRPSGGAPTSGPGGLPTRPSSPATPAIPTSGAPTSGPGGLPTRPSAPAGGAPASGPGGLPGRPVTGGRESGQSSQPGQSGPGQSGLAQSGPGGPGQSGASRSGAGQPGVGQPSQSGAGQSGVGQPGQSGQPGVRQPGQAGSGQPGSGQGLPTRPSSPAASGQPAPPAWPPAPGAAPRTSGSPSGPGTPGSTPATPSAPSPAASGGPAAPTSRVPSAPTPPASIRDDNYSPALDMTAEIPRVRDDWAPPAPAGNGQASRSSNDELVAAPRPDATMELPPIFREVESGWFRTRRPSPMRELTNGSNGASSEAAGAAPASGRPSGPGRPAENGTAAPARPVSSPPVSGAPTSGPAAPSAPAATPGRGGGPSAMPTGAPWSPPPGAPSSGSPLPPRTPSAPASPASSSPLPPRTPAPAAASNLPPAGPASAPTDRPGPGESVSWRSAADDGWRAAEAAGQDRDFNLTEGGLPKRVPMSQLVPGGVEREATAAHRRSPEAVRGLLSAYHRGVQRGRSQQSTDSRTPQPTQAGPSNPQGKEREA